MTDVIVVGAGPAGSAAALSARRAGASVLLLDAADFPRDKVCGDGIAPHALGVLARLGVDVEALVAGSAAVERLRLVSPSGIVARRTTRHPGWVVPRAVFDHRLRQVALDAGVRAARHTVRRVDVHRGWVDVEGMRADVIIGADGAESVVRRQLRVRRPKLGTVALAIRGYAPSAAWAPAEQLLTMARQHWPAYAWMFPIGDGFANVGYGELLQGPPPTRAHLLKRLQQLLPGVAPTRLRAHRLPLSTSRVRAAQGRVLLAGDAAGLINPVTGEGIFYAVLSGALAGAAATGGTDPGRRYRRLLARGLEPHFRHTDVLAWASCRPWVLDAGIAASREHQEVFDDLVELGLGAGRVRARTGVALASAVMRRRGDPTP